MEGGGQRLFTGLWPSQQRDRQHRNGPGAACHPENALPTSGGGGCNRRMGEIIGHVLAVLPAFLLACIAVAALPGPSTALFLHRTVRDGRAAGLAAVAGNEIGVFCWALAAASR